MAPALMTAFSERGVLSPDGSCKTFSAANEYARGEGNVSVYVKSLDAAIRDGNPIRSVIVGTATNFDEKAPKLSMSNPDAQEALLRRAYNVAGLPATVYGKTGVFEPWEWYQCWRPGGNYLGPLCFWQRVYTSGLSSQRARTYENGFVVGLPLAPSDFRHWHTNTNDVFLDEHSQCTSRELFRAKREHRIPSALQST